MAYVFDQRLSFIGHQYERWIGKSLENDGYKVLYTGILYGTDDRGVDLVAIKNHDVYLIQCKWRKNNSIWLDDIKRSSSKLCEAKVLFEDLPFKIHLRAYTTFASNDYKTHAPNIDFIVRPISEEELNDYSYSIHPQTSKTFEQYVRDECALINTSFTTEKIKKIGIAIGAALLLLWALFSFSPNKKVYIAPYSGQRYHSSSNCEGLLYANKIQAIKLNDAVNKGYSPCGYCFD